MLFKIKTTSKLFFGDTVKGRKFNIHEGYFDAKNIFSRTFLHHLKHRPDIVQDL